MKRFSLLFLCLLAPQTIFSTEISKVEICADELLDSKLAALDEKMQRSDASPVKKFILQNIQVRDGKLTYSRNLVFKSQSDNSGTLAPSKAGMRILKATDKSGWPWPERNAMNVRCNCDGVESACKVITVEVNGKGYISCGKKIKQCGGSCEVEMTDLAGGKGIGRTLEG